MAAHVPPEFIVQVKVVADALDTLDYFQVLRVEQEAPYEEIRAAYHRQARLFHPDRYQHLDMPELLKDLTRVAKRVAEAYVVLRDDAKRARYRQAISGPERMKNLRYSEEAEATERQERQAAGASTPQGKQLFHQATVAWANGDRDGAIKSLKLALVYESGNQMLLAKLAEWTTS